MNLAIKRTLILLGIVIAISGLLISCGGSEDPSPDGEENNDPCKNGPVLSVADMLHSFIDQNSGSIEVAVSGGNGEVLFSINGSDFSTVNEFDNLSTGNYTIKVRDEIDCADSIQIGILEFPEVSFKEEVLPILLANCNVSGCHGSVAGLPSWDSYSSVKSDAGRIRFRVTGKTMPPSTSGKSLTNEEILIIQNWVDVGAPNN